MLVFSDSHCTSFSIVSLVHIVSRLEYEVKKLQRKVDGMEVLQVSSGQDHVGTSERTTALVEVCLMLKKFLLFSCTL